MFVRPRHREFNLVSGVTRVILWMMYGIRAPLVCSHLACALGLLAAGIGGASLVFAMQRLGAPVMLQ